MKMRIKKGSIRYRYNLEMNMVKQEMQCMGSNMNRLISTGAIDHLSNDPDNLIKISKIHIIRIGKNSKCTTWSVPRENKLIFRLTSTEVKAKADLSSTESYHIKETAIAPAADVT